MSLVGELHEPPCLRDRVHDLLVGIMLADCNAVAARDDKIIVKAISGGYALDPDLLGPARPQIVQLVREIVDMEHFGRNQGGGGGSFLDLCMTPSGEHWGEHRDMEALIVLAMPHGLAGWCAPRFLWNALPGGMPYVWFDLEAPDLVAEHGWTARTFGE